MPPFSQILSFFRRPSNVFCVDRVRFFLRLVLKNLGVVDANIDAFLLCILFLSPLLATDDEKQ